MSEMNDLISREELLKEEATIEGYSSVRFVLVDDIMTAPSADIMECARAIKEYCKDRYCDDCIFDNGKSFSCRLQPIPTDWDLPEGKKGEEDAKET